MQVILSLLVTLCLCYTAVALQCKMCMQYDGTSDNDDVKQALQALKSIGNSNCKDNPGDASIPPMTCPMAPNGKKPVCSTASVGATYDIPNTKHSVGLAMYMRACHVVDDSQAMGECEGLDKYEDEIKKGMGEQANYYSNMQGSFCFCDGDQCNIKSATAPDMSAAGNVVTPAVLLASLFMCIGHLLF